jgi:hypothetical protein
MASALQLAFGDSLQRIAHELASMSGVDLQSAGPATVRAWQARGLALHDLAAGDMAEALKVMNAARLAGRRSRTPATNQPRNAAKETRQPATCSRFPPPPPPEKRGAGPGRPVQIDPLFAHFGRILPETGHLGELDSLGGIRG